MIILGHDLHLSDHSSKVLSQLHPEIYSTFMFKNFQTHSFHICGWLNEICFCRSCFKKKGGGGRKTSHKFEGCFWNHHNEICGSCIILSWVCHIWAWYNCVLGHIWALFHFVLGHIWALFRFLFGVYRQNLIFRVTCSKGTYIRSLCADFGKALGR